MKWLLGSTLAVLLVWLTPMQARAGCCELVKIDEETPPTAIRVCEPTADEECAQILFEGVIALHESQQVCTLSQTLQYQEYDASILDYGPPVHALCDGGNVEF